MKLIRSLSTRFQQRIIIVHIICWLIFITYELGMVFAFAGKLEKPQLYFIYYSINISFFYVCVSILNDTFSTSRIKLVKGLFCFTGLVALYLIIKGGADYFLQAGSAPIQNTSIFVKGFYQRNFVRGLYFTLLSVFYWSAGHISILKKEKHTAEHKQILAAKENAELEAALAKAQSAYRQQQLNPHMLFNTLNFIYTNVQRHSDDAARCVWLLSEIMRFSLEASGTDGKVILESEAAQLENLLEINHYRFPYPIFIDVDMDGNFQLFRIIPLILLTLTENVFKHGNLTEAQHPATIKLYVDEQGCLTFVTRNLKKTKSEHQRNQQIGLQNVRIRLDAEYRGNYKLEISEPADQFELTLTLNL